jgi:1-acyl-sn-glycerol-3-phosphate acyltransferase
MIAISFQDALHRVAQASRAKAREPAFRRDEAVIRRWRWIADGARRYFSGEVRGWHHVPTSGPFLVVSNHSGGLLMPDAYVFMSAWLDQRPAQPLFVLGHDLLFLVPGFEKLARSAGVLPGRMRYAEQVVEQGDAVLAYPGGEHEVFRPFTQRNQIQFNGHKGFVKLALQRRIPIVPLVSYGAQDVNLFLSRGTDSARLLGLHRMRVKILPLVAGLPFGLVPGFIPLLPMPTKITLEFQAPIDWSGLGQRDAEDPRVVTQCYNQITSRMQRALWRLARQRPNPFSRK